MHLKKRKWVWSLRASEPGSFSRASPRRALRIPIFVSLQTDSIALYKPKHYDAASEITEGIAVFPKHLHQNKLFSGLAFRKSFVVVVKNIFRKKVKENVSNWPQDFLLHSLTLIALKAKVKHTQLPAEAFGHFVSNLYIMTAFINSLPRMVQLHL